MNKILFIIVPIFIAAIVGGIFIGVNQMKKNPSNSLNTIRKTISDHNIDEFNKLVDVDKILDYAADDILTEKLSEDKAAYSVQQVANTYNNEIKPDFINVTKNAIDEYVKTGHITLPKDNLTNAQRWLRNSAINDCVIENMSKPKIIGNGKEATALVYFRNNNLKFTFEIELQLERIDNNQWKIVGAKGFNDYNKGLKRALDKKLDSLNAPIQDQIDEIIEVKDLNARIGEGDEYGFSQTLRIALKANVKSSKPLSKILGNIFIDDGNEESNNSITPFTIDMAYHPQGLQTFNVDKVLNPFVRGDVNIMKHGLKRSAIHVEINEVIFLDGTNIKILDRLPD